MIQYHVFVLPLKHKDTKQHKVLLFNNIFLVFLSALESLWQKKPRTNNHFGEQLKPAGTHPFITSAKYLRCRLHNRKFGYF